MGTRVILAIPIRLMNIIRAWVNRRGRRVSCTQYFTHSAIVAASIFILKNRSMGRRSILFSLR